MTEQALFFSNQRGEQLFAVNHETNNSQNVGVVFCHPFGEEKYRSYRAYVNFSRYLSKHNIPSFRFDVAGAGDSDGELIQSTIQTQIDDIKDAITYFQNVSKVNKIVLIGLRLGATIAALVAEQDQRINGLVLLSPIFKGATYWRELLRTKQFASISLNKAATKITELTKDLELTGSIEIEAQELSLEFVNELKSVNLFETKSKFKGEILITSLAKDSLAKDFSDKFIQQYSNSHSHQLWCEEEQDYWSIVSLYGQYNPEKTYLYTKNWLNQQGFLN